MTRTASIRIPNLLEVRDLVVNFRLPRRNLFAPAAIVHAVDGVSFDVPRGSTFGLVGESGSGKSTTALAVMRLTPITSGSVLLDGTDISKLGGARMRAMRRKAQIIFQDPYSSLNPRERAGAIVRRPMTQMAIGTAAERDARVAELFHRVGLRPEQARLFPHQFSGGQRQRIGIARALATQPDLIVCDEPVSALDVAIQAQILNLLRELQDEFGLTYLFISHDLGVVQYICDEIAVMYLGRIVEQADRVTLFASPVHPYTQALVAAVPSAARRRGKATPRATIEGDPPDPINPPKGCHFASRCPFTQDKCRRETPPLVARRGGGRVACHLVDEYGVGPRLDAAVCMSSDA